MTRMTKQTQVVLAKAAEDRRLREAEQPRSPSRPVWDPEIVAGEGYFLGFDKDACIVTAEHESEVSGYWVVRRANRQTEMVRDVQLRSVRVVREREARSDQRRVEVGERVDQVRRRFEALGFGEFFRVSANGDRYTTADGRQWRTVVDLNRSRWGDDTESDDFIERLLGALEATRP